MIATITIMILTSQTYKLLSKGINYRYEKALLVDSNICLVLIEK